jgi:hypothetical protein
MMQPPEPTPLSGDLRVVQLVGPSINPRLAGRWQMQVYEATTGSWRALLAHDLSRRPAHWRAEPTFTTEAEAIAHLIAYVRRQRRTKG